MPRLPIAALAVPLLLTACSSTHPEVIDRELAWADAMRTKDTAALTEIMDPDFLLTGEETSTLTAAFGEGDAGMTLPEWLTLLESLRFGPIEMSKVDTPATIGEDRVAVDMWMYLQDWRFGGQPLAPLYELTDVWVNRDGTWRVVSRHSRPLDVAEHGRPKPDFVSPRPPPPEPELPDAELPDADLPDIDVPEVDLPDAEAPEIDLPDVDSP